MSAYTDVMMDAAAMCRHVAYIAAIAVMHEPDDPEAAASALERLSPELVGADEFPSLTVAAQAIREAHAAREAAA